MSRGPKDTRTERVNVLLNLMAQLICDRTMLLNQLDALDVAIQLMTDTSISRYVKAVHAVQQRRNKYQRVKEAPTE